MHDRYSNDRARAYIDNYADLGENLARRVYTSHWIGADPQLVLQGPGNISLTSQTTDILGTRPKCSVSRVVGDVAGALPR